MRVTTAVAVAACVLSVGCGGEFVSAGSNGSETGEGEGGSMDGPLHEQPCGFDHWELAAPLLHYHGVDYAVVALPDGTVLVTGGKTTNLSDPPWEVLAAAERYDSAADEWTQVASMPAARYAHAQVVVADGRVLAIGGYGPDSPGDRVDRYDPALDQWSLASTLPFEVARPRAIAGTDNRVFLASSSGFLRSEDGGESWSVVVDPPDSPTLDDGMFAWDEDTFVIPGERWTPGYFVGDGTRPVQLYRWSTDSWEQVPRALAFLDTQAKGALRAYGPLSTTRMLVLSETTGQHGTYDGISPRGVSLVLDRLTMDAGWTSIVEGPLYGYNLYPEVQRPAVAYRPGWLWVGWSEGYGHVYEDASDRWCRTKAPEPTSPQRSSRVTLLADGRILLTGAPEVAGPLVTVAQIWSHDP